MGRLKIIQEDDSVERVAYLSDVQEVADDVDDLLEDVDDLQSDLAQHKLDYVSQFNEGFPSQAKDLKNNKTYTIKLQLSSEGNPQLISKEVI